MHPPQVWVPALQDEDELAAILDAHVTGEHCCQSEEMHCMVAV